MPETQVGYLAYALWAVFAPSQVQSWLGAGSATWQAVQGWLNSACAQKFTPGEFANFFIYTPNKNYPITCNGQSCANTPPQEFFGFVPTPDGGSALVYLLLTTSCAGAIWFRSRRQIDARVIVSQGYNGSKLAWALRLLPLEPLSAPNLKFPPFSHSPINSLEKVCLLEMCFRTLGVHATVR
jgi:hypothetical protein